MEKLTKCKTCGNEIAKDAKICPNCGAKNKHSSGCLIIIAAIAVLVAIGAAIGESKSGKQANTSNAEKKQQQQGNATIKKALGYLQKVDGVCRVDFVGNDVYVSFAKNELPTDYKTIANAAAMNGSRALLDAGEIPSRCSVWIIPEEQTAKVDGAYYSSTARKGKAQ